jgi:transcriptional regulator with XRE-family HTH domain
MTKNINTGSVEYWKYEIGGRLQELRKHYRLSQIEMAEKLGISINTYRMNDASKCYPSVLILGRLRNRLGVSMEWYLFGRGPMFWADVVGAGKKIHPDDLFGHEMEEMTKIMKKVPLVRHALLLYFQELKMKHKEIIREELEKDT